MRKFWMVKWANPPMEDLAAVRAELRQNTDRPTHVEHQTLEAAMIEAERLARVHPDRTFAVLQTVKVVKATIETETQEWIGDSLYRDSRDYGLEDKLRREDEALASRTGPDGE